MPDNYTESEVIDIINTVADRLCYKFKFGYHSAEDMKQQARLFAWQGLEKYDGKRPLENFLWTHVIIIILCKFSLIALKPEFPTMSPKNKIFIT